MESELSACSPPYTSNLMGSSHTCYFLSSMCHTHSLFISSPVPFAIPPACRLLYFRLFSGTAFLYAHCYLSDYPLVWFSKLRQVSCYLVVELHCKHIKYMKIQLYAHKFLNKISVNRITHHSVQQFTVGRGDVTLLLPWSVLVPTGSSQCEPLTRPQVILAFVPYGLLSISQLLYNLLNQIKK